MTDKIPESLAVLESISDRIRRGEPVGILEAIAAIDYQTGLQAERERIRAGKWWNRLFRWTKNTALAAVENLT